MKAIGSILLASGFLAGAYLTVAQVEEVNWTLYGICAAVMLVAVVMLYLERTGTTAEEGEKHTQDLDVLQASLTSLIEKVGTLESASADEEQLRVYTRIDAELMDDINTFVDARESMIPRLGMQTYANIMSSFANGERLLNRAWSASADGYVDEVRSCITRVRGEWKRAADALAHARSTQPAQA